MPRKKLVVLGSTGSIGENVLAVARSMPERFEVLALSAGAKWRRLAEQAGEFRPAAVGLVDAEPRAELEQSLRELDARVHFGPEAPAVLAAMKEADVVVNAIPGWAAFPSAVAALESGHVLALANKEALVVGGRLLVELARGRGAAILPVDSEHSAILQAMRSGARAEVARVIITASGGALRGLPPAALKEVTPEQALNHPTWTMGKKVTIDSATLMNKALEIVEARWLFDLDPDSIEVLIHPQSVVHSFVEFVDGSVIAQLGVADMKLPIQFALTYPDRLPGPVERLDLAAMRSLEFHAADLEEYPALALGFEVARVGGTSGAVLNAANEVAVKLFLQRRICFTDIVPLVQKVLRAHEVQGDPDIEGLNRADKWARQEAHRCTA